MDHGCMSLDVTIS